MQATIQRTAGNRKGIHATIRIVSVVKPFAERVSSMEELRELASSECGVACFIFLEGNVRSSKHVWFRRDLWHVLAESDWTEESAPLGNFGELGSGLILDAMERGCFYRYV